MKAIYETVKADVGIQAQSLNGNDTGRYFPMRKYGRIMAVLTAGAIAATKTAKIELLQAKDSGGTDAKGIPSTAAQAATATITANSKVNRATITLSTFLESGTITINGLTFTAHADTTTVANREFAIDGNDTADAAALATCINDATYGVPGVTATSALGVVTLVADDGYTITVSSDPDDGTCVKATVLAQAYVEVTEGQLDDDFTHIAVKVTTDAAIVVGSVVLRGHSRHVTSQDMAASASVEPGD